MRLVILEDGYALFWCPACDTAHAIHLGCGGWTLEGNAVTPVTQPSILVSRKDTPLCHCYLEGEKIRFCADSPHTLAGQTVDLPFFPDGRLGEGVGPFLHEWKQ